MATRIKYRVINVRSKEAFEKALNEHGDKGYRLANFQWINGAWLGMMEKAVEK